MKLKGEGRQCVENEVMIEVTAQGGRTRLDLTRHYNYRHFVTLSRTMADMKFLAWTLIILYIIQIPYMPHFTA